MCACGTRFKRASKGPWRGTLVSPTSAPAMSLKSNLPSAPETAFCPFPAQPRSEVYSLGVVLPDPKLMWEGSILGWSCLSIDHRPLHPRMATWPGSQCTKASRKSLGCSHSGHRSRMDKRWPRSSLYWKRCSRTLVERTLASCNAP